MDFGLRAAKSQDAASVAGVIIRSKKAFLPFAPLAHSAEQMCRWAEDTLLHTEQVVVATQGTVIVGVISTHDEQGDTWVNQLYVEPLFVSRGLGTMLLSHALSNVSNIVKLYTFQENFGARRFYRRHGFIEVAFSDGAANEEKCPDVLCVRNPAA